MSLESTNDLVSQTFKDVQVFTWKKCMYVKISKS